jgi:hypothetical protein
MSNISRIHASLGPEEIENRFGFHKAAIEGPHATAPKHSQLRIQFKEIAYFLDDVLPSSREKSLAITHLEEASMWSHKAVAKTAPLEEDRG